MNAVNLSYQFNVKKEINNICRKKKLVLNMKIQNMLMFL